MKKTLATIVSLLTLFSIASPILAVPLSGYPDFLFKDNLLNAYVVVGKDASPEDVIGAVDLAVRLASDNVELVPVPTSGEIVGGETNQVELGQPLTSKFETSLKSDDISNLKDGQISFKSDEYDYHEELVLGNSKLKVQTSLTSDTDYGANPYLETAISDIKYMYVLDDSIDTSKVTEDDYLDTVILGKDMKITDFGTNEVRVRTGDTYSLNVGDSVTVNGKTVKLENVGSSGSVRLSIDGVTYTVSGTQTRDGIDISVEDTFYADALSERGATLIMGKQASETYKDGDAFIGQDKNDPIWVWSIVSTGTGSEKPEIGVRLDKNFDDLTDNPVKVGEELALPNDYVKVLFRELTNQDFSKYRVYPDDSADLTNVGYGSSENVYVLKATENKDGFFLDSDDTGTTFDKYTDTIYLYQHSGNIEVLYVDKSDNKVHKSTIVIDDGATDTYFADLKYDDTTAQVLAKQSSGDLQFSFSNGEAIIVDTDTAMTKLGSTAGSAEPTDVQVSDGTTKQIGTRDTDVLTKYGVLIRNPDSNSDNDELEMQVPKDQVKAVISIVPGTADVSGKDAFIEKAKPITNAVAKLDTEIPNPETVDKNLILIGDGAVNSLSAKAQGFTYPTYGSSGKFKYGQGEAMIQVLDGVFKSGQKVVIVAGWEAEQTREACTVLQQYSTLLKSANTNAVKITNAGQTITPVTV